METKNTLLDFLTEFLELIKNYEFVEYECIVNKNISVQAHYYKSYEIEVLLRDNKTKFMSTYKYLNIPSSVNSPNNEEIKTYFEHLKEHIGETLLNKSIGNVKKILS